MATPCAYEGRERPSAATSFVKWSVAERRALLTDWGFEAICGCEECAPLEAGISLPASTRRAQPLSTTPDIRGDQGGSSLIHVPASGNTLGVSPQNPRPAALKEGQLSKGDEYKLRRRAERAKGKVYIHGQPILDYGVRKEQHGGHHP